MSIKKNGNIYSSYHRIPEKPLFHYSSLKGLHGIVTSKSIWATHYMFLNDSTEYTYGIGLAKTMLKKFIKEESKNFCCKLSYDEMKAIEDRADHIENIPVFVSSFSEICDLLSQWRGYSGIEGVSIGFDFSKLEDKIVFQGFYLTKCIYKKEEQLEMIDSLWDDSKNETKINGDKDAKNINTYLVNVALNFLGKCMLFSPIFKDESFSEEKEWRLISNSFRFNKSDPRIKFRIKKSAIIPYVEFKLTEKNKPLSFSKIILGPSSRNNALSEFSVRSLFSTKDVDCSDIKYSKIPYKEIGGTP
jgi:hypothetical protein